MRTAVVVGLLITLGCQAPPPGKVFGKPESSSEAQPEPVDEEFVASAHRDAYARLLEDAIEPLRLADPLAAAQLGQGPLMGSPISLVDRRALASALEPVWSSVGEIDESALEPEQVIVLRTIRFGLGRIHDELQRRPQVRVDPLAGIRAVERLTGEIEYRLIRGECNEACGRAISGLSDTLASTHQQLAASSLASATEASKRARALAERLRGLGARSSTPALTDAAIALDTHASALDLLVARLPDAETLEWSSLAPRVPADGGESVRRLPGPMGERALARLLGAEERIDLPPAKLWALIKQHVGRWKRMRGELIGPELGEDPSLPVDLARCTAARERIKVGLAPIAEIDPPTLDCGRWLTIQGPVSLSEGELVLSLIDLGWIEPQRRRLRGDELPAVALVAGQWSPEVHRHLRRVMLLARLDEPHARARALDEGRAALCLAGAAVWIHGQLGPVNELGLMLGDDCALLGDAKDVEARVIGDPRSALAGTGLSLIGDEPAAMAGFDRFWWAPLGLMRLLATPAGTNPDTFRLPSDAAVETGEAEVEVQIENLDPATLD